MRGTRRKAVGALSSVSVRGVVRVRPRSRCTSPEGRNKVSSIASLPQTELSRSGFTHAAAPFQRDAEPPAAAGDPHANRLDQLADVAATAGRRLAAHAERQREPNNRHDDVRRPHRPEGRDVAAVRERLATDQTDVVNREDEQADADDESDAAARKAQADRRADEDEDQTGSGEREFLLDLDVITISQQPRLLGVELGHIQPLIGGQASEAANGWSNARRG